MQVVTGALGSMLEAWQELRIHRTRVLLSLIGVAVAVCSLTTVIALGTILQQSTAELNERMSGRPATLYVSASTADGKTPDTKAMQKLWQETVQRYGIDFASRVARATVPVDSPSGVVSVSAQAVDQPYGEMHRVRITEGTWFTPENARALAPAVIVNQVFWDRLGEPAIGSHPTISLGGYKGTVAIVVGVYPSADYETEPAMYMLADQLDAFTAATAGATASADPSAGMAPSYEMWVPTTNWQELAAAVKRDLTAALGDGSSVQVDRQDAAQYGDDPLLVTRTVIGGIAVLVLLLGALGLINISLVTVKQRVREIGIRRSFGATADRVFFAVMMESVVATVAAGAVGVGAAILIVQSPAVHDLVGQGLVTDFPPFPIDAALLGLAAASLVGAIAGLLPALVAVRVKVIDAIRF